MPRMHLVKEVNRSTFLTVHDFSPRTNPLPKPHRTGDYGHHHPHGHQHDQGHEMADYGPASYVPGDR